MFTRVVTGVLGLLFCVLVIQAVIPRTYTPEPREPVVEQLCLGTPIVVDYAFTGGYLEPWACESQCDDNKQHYIVYSNGKATQCEPPPGCNDWGEDTGVTCRIQ